jgi:hypothetical protein
MNIFDKEGLLDEMLAQPSKFAANTEEFSLKSRLDTVKQESWYRGEPLPPIL